MKTRKMKRDKLFKAVIVTLGLLLCCQAALACSDSDPSSAGITPTLVSGNTPPEIPLTLVKIPPSSGTYALGTGWVTVEFSDTACGQVVSWTVSENIVVEDVYAKGGNAYNDYDYTSTNPHPTSDGNLHCPLAGGSGKYADFSHVCFVFHYKLSIGKTVTPKFTRTYAWTIDKSCDGSDSLTLATGETYNYPFSWTADVSGYTDSDWKVTGTITIANNTPFAATITGISDVLSGPINAAVSCPVALPYVLPSGQTLVCTYSAGLPGAANGTNTATVATSTPLVEGGTATAPYTFGDPTTLVDECITVIDDCGGSVEVCCDAAPHTENYTCQVGPYDVCGEYTYTNTASFTTNDQGVTGSDSCVVTVHVPCIGGCTLTQGYWKTHSGYGPAPYDDTWAVLGEDTPFFLSGQSYYEVLWTPPAGNAYYILAHQYIAAELNFINGADATEVQTEFDSAASLFTTNSPDYVAGLKGNAKKAWVSLAAVLDYYNNGLLGPGHCDEE
jgi:hypothetical protein